MALGDEISRSQSLRVRSHTPSGFSFTYGVEVFHFTILGDGNAVSPTGGVIGVVCSIQFSCSDISFLLPRLLYYPQGRTGTPHLSHLLTATVLNCGVGVGSS